MFQHRAFPNQHAPRDGCPSNTTLEGVVHKDTALDGTVNTRAIPPVDMSDNSKPGPKPSVTDEEILNLFRETSDPVLSTAEVAEQLPLERRSVYDRLVSLRDDGRLASKQIGGRNTVWWLSGTKVGP